MAEVRPQYFPGQHPGLWPTERRGRVSCDYVNVRFREYRQGAGLAAHLHPHCLRQAYVTHLIEDGFDPFFVQQQVGHAWGSTTALYTGVSGDYKNRALATALANLTGRASRRPGTKEPAVSRKNVDYRWHLRQVMASRGLFATTELAPLPAERGVSLSSAQI